LQSWCHHFKEKVVGYKNYTRIKIFVNFTNTDALAIFYCKFYPDDLNSIQQRSNIDIGVFRREMNEIR